MLIWQKNALDVLFPSGMKYMSLFLIFIKFMWICRNMDISLAITLWNMPQLITMVNGHQSMSVSQSEQTLAKNNVRLGVLVMPGSTFSLVHNR